MFSKQLLLRLGLIFFLVSLVGILVFKVDTLSVDVQRKSVQAQFEPLLFMDGQSSKTHIKYEIGAPLVKLTDSGDVKMKLDLGLTSGLNQKWGSVEFVAKVVLRKENDAFYLKIPEKVQLNVSHKHSNEAGFKLWHKDASDLIEAMTGQLNEFFFSKNIYELKGGNLRVQAVDLDIHEVKKKGDALNIILDVDQGIFIVITYFVMFLSVFTFAFAYFLVGGRVGFKDAANIGFRDPKKTPRGYE